MVSRIPLDDHNAFATACARDETLHTLALDLAANRLPAALDRNLTVFTDPLFRGYNETDLALPMPLFFALLSSKATICSCLTVKGVDEAETAHVQRAAVPILHGIIEASTAGYGYAAVGGECRHEHTQPCHGTMHVPVFASMGHKREACMGSAYLL
jgi:hypothetical protein